MTEGAFRLKWYEPPHLDQLVGLHKVCFGSEDWTADDFFRFATHPGRNNVVKVLADAGGTVYGSFLYTLDTQSCRFRRIGVWPALRRRGLARFMANSLCGANSPLKRKLFVARVRESNKAACLFFGAGMGFLFDPKKPREQAGGNEDYYEFTYAKTRVRVVGTGDQ